MAGIGRRMSAENVVVYRDGKPVSLPDAPTPEPASAKAGDAAADSPADG